MKAGILLIALAAAYPCAACVIRGTVLDGDSGKPLAGTKVYAKPHGPGKVAVLTTTSERGAFCFERLEPGQYEVAAAHTGYLHALAGPLLKVEGPAELPALSIKLLHAATIAGVVLGADGEPREGAYVNVYHRAWQRGWTPDEVANGETDEHGTFRFGQLPAGTYFVGVRPQDGDGVQYIDDKGQPIRNADALTYYRGSLTFAQATPIRLEAGQQLTNLVLTIEKAPQRRFSGRLAATVRLEEPRRLHLSSETAPTMQIAFQPDGSFSADGLLPAKYQVHVVGSGTPFSESLEVDLTNGDVDGFVVEPVPSVEVRFSVRGAHGRVDLNAVNVDDGSSRGKPVDPGGSFLLPLRPGLYRVETPANSHLFVESLIVGGQPKADVMLDLRKGSPGAVEVIVSANVARVEGKLETPPASRAATVVMMDEARSRVEVLGQSQAVDQTGTFKLDSLAPGKYRVFAIEGFDDSYWGSLELAAALREKSVGVVLGKGEVKAVTVPMISAEDWAAALKKVGM